MSDPFRSELEAAHQRIAKLEVDHKARVTELERENARLRKRLLDAAPPSQSKTGKTFFALGMTTLGVSLAAGMVFARMGSPPVPTPILLTTPKLEELANENAAASDNDFDRDEAGRALSAIHIDDCAPAGSDVSGHAKITFTPSGIVSLATVDPPYAGTSIGACVEERYRAARVSKFSGAPRVVGKSFFIKK